LEITGSKFLATSAPSNMTAHLVAKVAALAVAATSTNVPTEADDEGYISLLQTRAVRTQHDEDYTSNLRDEHEEILEFLSSFRPCAACVEPLRLGSATDGGYVMCADLLPTVTAAYSFGIEVRDDWGAEISTRLGVDVHQFDCYNTEKPPCPEGKVCNFKFNPQCVGEKMNKTDTEHPFIGLRDMLHARGDDEENGSGSLVMKMDVEGSEWEIFADETNRDLLKRFSQIIVEFHWLGSGPYLPGHDQMQRAAMRNLMKDFVVVHLHENNCCEFYEIDDFQIARLVEATLVRRDLIAVGQCDPDPPQTGPKNVLVKPDLQSAHLPGGTGLSFSQLSAS